MDRIEAIYQILQKLIGLHRQLYDYCREEKTALVDANLSKIQEISRAKQLVIENIKQRELERIKYSTELSLEWKKPLKELTLNQIALDVEFENKELAERLRSAWNVLKLLIERTEVQNSENKKLVENSIHHITQMKNNILGEAVPRSDLYSQKGQSIQNTAGARILSKEA